MSFKNAKKQSQYIEHKPWHKRFQSAFRRQWVFYTMMLPGLFFLILFCYIPMPGVIIAFKDYSAVDGIFGSAWMDPWYKNFEFFFKSDTFTTITFNTIVYNLIQGACGL